uniref:Uncharacterized protein involved in outer membrane biogenesis n=1 Tax=uncultured bacterium BLR7 TaxID=506523 RepID=C0INQ6_9BACT|nr:uncharacterized protein involved in outer membrane biogenesis [uncultured bacterium BLR7]
MKLKTGIWIGVGVVAAGLISVPFLLPLDTYKPTIENAASAALGRKVQIRGPLHLAVYPQLGISLSDVTVANLPGARDGEMIAIGSVLVGAELVPLISGELRVTEIVLQKPVIHLEVAKDGTPNWRLGPQTVANASPSARPANATAAAPAAGGFRFRSVNIDDGELTYFDAATNKTESFHAIGIRMYLQPGPANAPLNGALTINGSVTYNNEPLKIDTKVDRFGPMLNGQPTPLHVGITSNIINADFSGTLSGEGAIAGALKMGAHSVRSFAAWSGHPMPPGNGFGLMAMEGQFSANDGVYQIRKTHMAFDSMSMSTDIAINTKGPVPEITGLVQIDRLDVNPYLAPGKGADTVAANKAKAAAHPEAPLEFGWLKAANADMKLVVGGLVTPNIKLDQAVVAVLLKDGVLKADMTNITAYGGTGKGNLVLDASGPEPTLRETFEIAGVKARPFLDDSVGIKRIDGIGNVKVEFTSKGVSEAAIIKNLNGKGSMKFTKGAISGADLTQVSRVLQSVLTAEVLKSALSPDAKTEFGEMTATFTVQNGVVRTNDFLLDNPTVQMTAKGSADLSTHQLDLYMEPRAKKGIPGLKLVDIGVPFNVKGDWDNPSYVPNAGGIAKSVVNKLGEGAKLPIDIVKNPGGALKSLLGGK